jgi:hypothetical protein
MAMGCTATMMFAAFQQKNMRRTGGEMRYCAGESLMDSNWSQWAGWGSDRADCSVLPQVSAE